MSSAISSPILLVGENPRATVWSARDWIAVVVLAAITFGLYFQTRNFDFIKYDDQAYVYQNLHIINGFSWSSFCWALTVTVNYNWHPLTTLAWLLIRSVFGLNGGVFHTANNVLHTLNVVLLFVFLRKSTDRFWPSLIATALWGLHPMRVESVAWVSELKDVFFGAMWLMCMLAYLHYTRHRTVGRYIVVAVFQILAILAKPMAVTLPAALLLLDIWPLQNNTGLRLQWWKARALEKLPLAFISAGAIIVGIVIQIRNNAAMSLKVIPLGARIENALFSYCAYLKDTIWPARLSIFYPHPWLNVGNGIPWYTVAMSAAMMLVLSAIVCINFKSKPYLFVGWFWFIGILIPVIGLFQSGEQARANRFTYISAIGLTVAIVWLVADISQRRPLLRVFSVAAGLIFTISFTFKSDTDISYWHDSTRLFEHVLSLQPDNYVAMNILTFDYRLAGDNKRALKMGERATQIAPYDANSHDGYAMALSEAGQLKEAVHEFFLAIACDRKMSTAFDGLGMVRERQANECVLEHKPGEHEYQIKAIKNFRDAIQVEPDAVESMDHLAWELASTGSTDEAINIWQQAAIKAPTFGDVQGHLADALRLKGDLRGAVEHYQAAIADQSQDPDWETTLAYLVATNSQSTRADVQAVLPLAEKACNQTKHQQASSLDAYAACLARVGRFDDAISAAQQGIDQANAAHQSAVAAGIQKRLAKYKLGLPYVAGQDLTVDDHK